MQATRVSISVSTRFAKYTVGQIVRHRLFNYRGVVVDVDPDFRGTPEWYDKMAPSRPPKDAPWYHVLMHGTSNRTYCAERNLEPDDTGDVVDHPDLNEHFSGLVDGVYVVRRLSN